jgi:hypothetical protein
LNHSGRWFVGWNKEPYMKTPSRTIVITAVATLFFTLALASKASAGVSVNINLGVRHHQPYYGHYVPRPCVPVYHRPVYHPYGRPVYPVYAVPVRYRPHPVVYYAPPRVVYVRDRYCR